MKRICIVGTGALGGLIGARLALAGAVLTLIDRGEQLAALRSRGLSLFDPDGSLQTTRAFRTASRCQDVGRQDLVILTVKAYDLPGIASSLSALFGEQTVVVPMQNGIPWWYFERHDGEHRGLRLRSADPTGQLQKSVDSARVVGCVAYPGVSVDSPGVIRHAEGNRFAIGELDGTMTDRLAWISQLLESAGFQCRPISDIRAEIWLKALGSVSLNPVSVLTRSTMAEICRAADSRILVRRMMEEAQAVATRLGITLRKTIDDRLAGAEAVGEHKTSMLQDFEAGRPLEIDAIIGAVIELGLLTQTPTPCIGAVHVRLQSLAGKEVRTAGHEQEMEIGLADIGRLIV